MPTEKPWMKYQEWSEAYDSDVIYVQLPMQPTIVLGSAQAVIDLLEKRSHIYSDRVVPIMVELMSWAWNFAVMPYGPRWRAHRRAFHQYFNQLVVHKYRPVQLQEVRAYLLRVLDSTEDIRVGIRWMVASVILRIVYGKRIEGLDDEFVQLAQESVVGFCLACIVGVYWVDYLPILKYVPSWFPGAKSQKLVAHFKPIAEAVRDKPFDEVKVSIADGTAHTSVAQTLIERIQTRYGGTKVEAEQDELARNVTGLAYVAGAETTASALESFFMAMAMYPQVQKIAQAELDRVVGRNRLPNFDDIEHLPYLRAVAMETLRWLPILPFGIPHRVIADDTYKGYFIPKGTVVIPNVWQILHDPQDYPEPKVFKPERFIGKDGAINKSVRDPATVAFGFGRRICPGRHFSDNTLMVTLASVLHVFNVTAKLDKDGLPAKLIPELTSGMVASPVEVACELKPRSSEAERLIREGAVEFGA